MIRAYIYLNSVVPLNDIYINKILELLNNCDNDNDWINIEYSKVNYKRFNLLNHKLMYTELIFI
jgi:hypothetical protein